MFFTLIILVLLAAGIYVFLQQPQFGKPPSNERLKRIEASPNYSNGQFQNIEHTPALAEGTSYATVMRQFFFTKKIRNKPAQKIPSVKNDLLNLDRHADVLVWFGHSSYFLQVDGKRILVDPVLSGNASPLWFTTKSFKGADAYTLQDLPAIDYLILTHDHYDHLDYKTVVQLKDKALTVITGLGVGSHLEHWGFDMRRVIEKDWNEIEQLHDGFTITSTTARHFSGRKFKRNNTMWTSFVLKTPSYNIFIGGDSGYGKHFETIGKQHGPFDLVILENGQYNHYWKYIHMMPEEVVQAAENLQAKKLLPVHFGKFALSLHPWDEPIIRVIAEAERKKMNTLSPMIGELVYLNKNAGGTNWWKGLD
jgi:L-ascorbate metabolism protein UlaG (beta-lactamase superfamily)